MERREFLKYMGLGGLALTVPKSLGIVTARMTDLSNPPIHAGLARFRNLGGIMVYDIGFKTKMPLDREAFKDLECWNIHVAARGSEDEYIPILETKATSVLVLPSWITSRHSQWKPKLSMPERRFAQTSLDIWFVPTSAPRLILPSLTAVLFAGRHSNDFSLASPTELTVPVRSIRLERARALAMGLISPSEPFETI